MSVARERTSIIVITFCATVIVVCAMLLGFQMAVYELEKCNSAYTLRVYQ